MIIQEVIKTYHTDRIKSKIDTNVHLTSFSLVVDVYTKKYSILANLIIGLEDKTITYTKDYSFDDFENEFSLDLKSIFLNLFDYKI